MLLSFLAITFTSCNNANNSTTDPSSEESITPTDSVNSQESSSEIKDENELDSQIKEVRRTEQRRDEEIGKCRKDGIAYIRVQDNEDVDYELSKFLETPDFFETHFTSREEYYPAHEVFFAECRREFKYRQERLKEEAEKKANRKRI